MCIRDSVRTGLLIIATIATQTKVHPLLFEQIIDGLNAQNSRGFTMLVSSAGKDVGELFAQFDGGAVLDQNACERTVPVQAQAFRSGNGQTQNTGQHVVEEAHRRRVKLLEDRL